MAFSRLLTVLVLIHNTGGLLGAEVRSSIIGGHDAPKGKWPWMVHLNLSDDAGSRWRCDGTILNERWVMTAANCWKRHPASNWRRSFVVVGAYNLQQAAQRYMAISTVVSHPDFRALSSGYINNIALVKLKKPVKFTQQVAPVRLPSADNYFGTLHECWIVGWGNIGTNVPLSSLETLQELKITIISHSKCKAKYSALTSDMLCAGEVVAGGKDTCKVCVVFVRPKGDNGSPLMCRVDGGGYVQVGIMSYGSPDGCGLSEHPGVYTKVSKYLRFINDYIHHGLEPSTELWTPL